MEGSWIILYFIYSFQLYKSINLFHKQYYTNKGEIFQYWLLDEWVIHKQNDIFISLAKTVRRVILVFILFYFIFLLQVTTTKSKWRKVVLRAIYYITWLDKVIVLRILILVSSEISVPPHIHIQNQSHIHVMVKSMGKETQNCIQQFLQKWQPNWLSLLLRSPPNSHSHPAHHLCLLSITLSMFHQIGGLVTISNSMQN